MFSKTNPMPKILSLKQSLDGLISNLVALSDLAEKLLGLADIMIYPVSRWFFDNYESEKVDDGKGEYDVNRPVFVTNLALINPQAYKFSNSQCKNSLEPNKSKPHFRKILNRNHHYVETERVMQNFNDKFPYNKNISVLDFRSYSHDNTANRQSNDHGPVDFSSW